MGVWEPGRDLANTPPLEAECQFAFHEQTDEGVNKWAALRGRIQDATSAEMVALLMALTAPLLTTRWAGQRRRG